MQGTTLNQPIFSYFEFQISYYQYGLIGHFWKQIISGPFFFLSIKLFSMLVLYFLSSFWIYIFFNLPLTHLYANLEKLHKEC